MRITALIANLAMSAKNILDSVHCAAVTESESLAASISSNVRKKYTDGPQFVIKLQNHPSTIEYITSLNLTKPFTLNPLA